MTILKTDVCDQELKVLTTHIIFLYIYTQYNAHVCRQVHQSESEGFVAPSCYFQGVGHHEPLDPQQGRS